jgi:hypothetical protein
MIVRTEDWQRPARAIIVACCLVSALLVLADVQIAARPPLTAFALTVGTGLAVTGWIQPSGAALFGALTLSTGTSIVLLVSLLAVEVQWWHPAITVAGLLIASAISIVGQLTRRSETAARR